MTRPLAAMIAFCFFHAAFGCAAPISAIKSETTATRVWPQQLAGRALRVNTGDYALYANDAETAAILKGWLDEQLTAFHLRYGRNVPGPGIVFAIESSEDPFPTAGKVEDQNPDRHLRPYCVAWEYRKAYFRESFSMSYVTAANIGLLRDQFPKPAWICFLTADSHLIDAFYETADQRYRDWTENVWNKMPPEERARIAPPLSMMMLKVMRTLILWKSCSLDVRLMKLQRREILFRTLIRRSFEDGPVRTARLAEVRREISKAWTEIWRRRPRD